MGQLSDMVEIRVVLWGMVRVELVGPITRWALSTVNCLKNYTVQTSLGDVGIWAM